MNTTLQESILCAIVSMNEVNLPIFERTVTNYASVLASGYPLNTDGVLHSFENPLAAEQQLARTLFRQQAIRERLKADAFKSLCEEPSFLLYRNLGYHYLSHGKCNSMSMKSLITHKLSCKT